MIKSDIEFHMENEDIVKLSCKGVWGLSFSFDEEGDDDRQAFSQLNPIHLEEIESKLIKTRN